MSVVAELFVSADDFVLADGLRAAPEMVLECELLVPIRNREVPYVWAEGGDHAAFVDAAKDDPTVERIEQTAELQDGALYRICWSDNDLFRAIDGGDATILQAKGAADQWFLKVRSDSRASLRRFQDHCHERGIDFELERLVRLTEPKMGQYDVTPKQREAILTALELGYFDTPRTGTLEDVAAELEISNRAASERLRRGLTNLVTNTLSIGRPSNFDA